MKILSISFALGILFIASPSRGATTDPLSAAARAISVYPADIRQATQTTLAHPATLAQLGQIQAKSSSDFKKLSSSLSPELEKKLWQVIRFPSLLQDLVGLGPKGDGSSLLSNYPKEVQAAAKELFKDQFNLLQQSAEIGNKAQAQFGKAIEGLPAPAKAAFQSVAGHSEIFQVLNQALGLSKIDPDSLKKSLPILTQEAQKLSTLIAAAPPSSPQKKIQAEKGDDPKALAALSKADRSFKAQNDYELDQDPHPKGAAQVNIGYTPDSSLFIPIGWAYPFWFGWPAWDPFPFW